MTAPTPPAAEAAQPRPRPARRAAGRAREAWRTERPELIATVLLSLATLLSAWGTYQATRWKSAQGDLMAAASSLRVQGNHQAALADRNLMIDVDTFLAWVEAESAHDTARAAFMVDRFRAEFVPAWQAWLGSGPRRVDELPPGTPFERPEYVLAARVETERLFDAAEARVADAEHAGEVGDGFVLVAVVFASVLFLSGMASRVGSSWARWTMVAMAAATFLLAAILEFSLPQKLIP